MNTTINNIAYIFYSRPTVNSRHTVHYRYAANFRHTVNFSLHSLLVDHTVQSVFFTIAADYVFIYLSCLPLCHKFCPLCSLGPLRELCQLCLLCLPHSVFSHTSVSTLSFVSSPSCLFSHFSVTDGLQQIAELIFYQVPRDEGKA